VLTCGPARIDLKSIEERFRAEAQRRREVREVKENKGLDFFCFSAPLRLCVRSLLGCGRSQRWAHFAVKISGKGAVHGSF
jgi:hypothetical protein